MYSSRKKIHFKIHRGHIIDSSRIIYDSFKVKGHRPDSMLFKVVPDSLSNILDTAQPPGVYLQS
jgi:hypothetical protein